MNETFSSSQQADARYRHAARQHAKTHGIPFGDALQQVFRTRLLARIFSEDTDRWVLKGGSAILARHPQARGTRDLDIMAHSITLDTAVGEIVKLASTDLGDQLTFTLGGDPKEHLPAEAQPHVRTIRLSFTVRLGVREHNAIPIDLVTGSELTTSPDRQQTSGPDIGDLQPPLVRLYPVVDHIADKVAATAATYGRDHRPSHRHRDLIDLVIFALKETPDPDHLRIALTTEWRMRQLEGSPHFDPPEAWRRTYPKAAREHALTKPYANFDDAVALVRDFLAPAMHPPPTLSPQKLSETFEHREKQ